MAARLRRLCTGGIAVGAIAALVGCSGASDSQDQLVIGGWGAGFTEATVANLAQPFEDEHDIEIQFHDAPGEQAATIRAMAQANNMEWDTVDSLSPEFAFSIYHDGLAAEMPDDVRAELEELLPEEMVTSHGMTFSTTGFVVGCNEDLMDVCPETVEDVWNVEDFPGERAMIDRPLIMLTAALAADGVEEEDMFPMDLDRAFEKLEEIKPHVRTWYSAGDQFEQLVRDDQVVTGMWWSGRSAALAEEGQNISVSWDGAVYEPAQNFVLKDAPHEELAWEYIKDVAANTQGQADWASTLFYGVPSAEALDLMDDETARSLPDFPENKELMVTPDYQWYAENREEVERRWVEFLSS